MSFYRISCVLIAGFIVTFLINPNLVESHHPSPAVLQGSGKAEEGSISSDSMLNSPTASTLGKNHASLGFVFQNLRFNPVPAGDAHDLHHRGRDIHGKNHEEFYMLQLGYGVLKNLDLFLSAPIVSKASIQVEGHQRLGNRENSEGFGDMRLLAKYRFWTSGLEAALLAAAKFPTGETSEKDGAGRKFEIENQAGSGSWDGEFGMAVSRNFWERLSLAQSFPYELKGKGGQEQKAGNVFRYNLGASVAVRKRGTYPNLRFITELNFEWAAKERSRTERRVFDSGRTTVFFTPGVFADCHPRFSAFWGMPIPISQNLGGEHEELKHEILTGFSVQV